MAFDTPVLERDTTEEMERAYSVQTRLELLAEEEHNARIRERYSRLINPENKVEDVLSHNYMQAPVSNAQPVLFSQPVMRAESESVAAPVINRPYRVEDARTNSDLFRADSAINRVEQTDVAQPVMNVEPTEEESEDLRPTPTTIQYQTVAVADEQKKVSFATDKRGLVFGKREKIIVAVFVAVVIALLVLVVVNASVIANLNAEIANVQESITTVRGALAGVNSTVEDIIHNAVSH